MRLKKKYDKKILDDFFLFGNSKYHFQRYRLYLRNLEITKILNMF